MLVHVSASLEGPEYFGIREPLFKCAGDTCSSGHPKPTNVNLQRLPQNPEMSICSICYQDCSSYSINRRGETKPSPSGVLLFFL